MGKALRWFRNILALKQPDSNPSHKPLKNKRGWSFVSSSREKPSNSSSHQSHGQGNDNKHAAVAIAAAIVIQSCFRGYLARKALRALKGLVKLQALVRGHIMRRQTAETMRCMQAMLRAQARARSGRAYLPESPQSSTMSCQLHPPGPQTPEKFEPFFRAKTTKQDNQSPKIKGNGSRSSSRTSNINQDKVNFGSSWSDPRLDEPTFDPRLSFSTGTYKTDEDRADKLLEIDTGRSHMNPRRRNIFSSSHSGLLIADNVSHSYTTSKDSNLFKVSEETETSPQINSATYLGASSRRGPLTPTKSDGSKSFLCLRGYSNSPSYMAYTESSRAKVRSASAPKLRPQYDRSMSSAKRYSVHGLGEHNPRSNAKVSTIHDGFIRKAYPGSGQLDRVGMTVSNSTVVYYSGYLN